MIIILDGSSCTKKSNLKKEQGDTRRFLFEVKDKSGNAVNLTSWTQFRMIIDVLETPISETSDVAVTTGTVSSAVNGQLYFPCLGTITAGDYFYEIRALDNNGEIVTLASGEYKVLLNGQDPNTPLPPLEMVRGQEFYCGWRFKWDATTPKNLTGFAVKIQIKPFVGSDRTIASFTEASPEVLALLEYGAIDLTIPSAQTLLYNFQKAVIDCYVTNGADGDRSISQDIIFNKGVST